MVYLLGELMVTHTQMLVLLLIFPLMSRVGMINFKWPAPFVVVTSEPGVGKSEMMRGYEAGIHRAGCTATAGPALGGGHLRAHRGAGGLLRRRAVERYADRKRRRRVQALEGGRPR